MKEIYIEDIILKHSKRGMDILREYIEADFCKRAADEILSWKRNNVILTTGFYVGGCAETDGPLGTVILAYALKAAGYIPIIVTDSFCKNLFEKENFRVIYADEYEKSDCFEKLLDNINPSGLISIERCGKNIYGDYANMRGISIKAYTAPIDELFEAAYEKNIPTIGVGDGGNEIGMGNLKEIIKEKLDLVPCKIKVKHLIIATVSNWGAYAIAAYMQKISGKKLLKDCTFLKEYMKYIVKAGCVDGVTKKHEATVDGFKEGMEEGIYKELYEYVNLN